MLSIPLYSAVTVHSARVWRFFEAGRGTPLPGEADRVTDRVHTNLPRSGLVGFPLHWTMTIEQIRLVSNVVLDLPGTLRFRVNGTERFVVATDVLLKGPIQVPPTELVQNVPFHAEAIFDEVVELGSIRSIQQPRLPSTQIADVGVDVSSWHGEAARDCMEAWDTITDPLLVWCVLEGPRKIVVI